jgi:hypothetical protein
MEGVSRAEDEKDQKKALSIWKYLSEQISHESLGIDLPVTASHVLPDTVPLLIAIDACKIGRKRLTGSRCMGKRMKESFLFQMS